MLMVGVGIMMMGYLGWTFLSWGYSIPQISGTEVLGTSSTNTQIETPFVQQQQITFGDLLHFDTRADPAPKIDPVELSLQSKRLGLKEKNTQKPPTTEFTINIPKLGIKNAKVKTNVDGTSETAYLPVLKEAGAHFKGTGYPGEIGNSFLFGHSMLPILAGTKYESIFTNLPKLKTGDLIQVQYNGNLLTYTIRQTAVLDPSDVSILRQPANQRLLTLMTCIPPGFGSNRFVTIAELTG